MTMVKSWNNLGKTLFELSILNKLLKQANKRIEFLGIKNLNEIKKNNEQVIFLASIKQIGSYLFLH